MKSNLRKIIKITAVALSAAFVTASIIAKKEKPDSVYESDPSQKNPFEGKRVVFIENETETENADGVRGHLEAVGDAYYQESVYSKYVKRCMDIVLSFGGLVVLSPLLIGIAIAIKIDDPGPALFTQKRLGKNKQYFKLHKFRSMKLSTPKSVPTHMLEDPDQYITRVGKFLRAHSLDELPQIWDIFVGNMSVIGPRPGLWNQDLLTAERDKYNANDIKPGLTGWAQINGRDELEIPDKARLDGEYTKNLGFKMDIKCFLGSLHVFGSDDSVVEGGTGEIHKTLRHGVPDNEPKPVFGCDQEIQIDESKEKRVLITGAGSYIGESFLSYAAEHFPNLHVNAVGTMEDEWKKVDFSSYDCVYHVAGIAHADVGNVDEATKEMYYTVNTDLAIEVAKKAKKEGVKQFIFMSSMIVYGESWPYGTKKVITRETIPAPANFYGDSKWQADKGVRELEGDGFKVAVLRPPMIYGKGSKGNYPTLAKLAKKLPVFPDVDNQRSMLHIDNLCEFLGKLMISGVGGIFFPQNDEYTRTSYMVQEISTVCGHTIIVSKLLNPAVFIASHFPGKVSELVNKAFGNSYYDQELSTYSFNYRVRDLKASIEATEGKETTNSQKKALQLASVASMIDQFNMPSIKILQSLGYQVDVVADFTNPGTITKERAEYLKKRLADKNVRVFDIAIPRSLRPIEIASAYKQVKELLNKENYSILHCHSPIGGVIAREAAKEKRKQGLKVIYTAHGFHFYDGAPRKNWLIYYPIEKYYSRTTDVLITINQEDYKRAKEEFQAKKTVYIPGVGVDGEKFAPRQSGRERIRQELRLSEQDIMLLSVGELNENKNHISVIRAIKDMENVVYVIVGKGEKKDELQFEADKNGVNLRLMGYRSDVADFYNAADVYILPSIREGLNVSLMEAMASGLPVACSNIRGNTDLLSECLFEPTNIDQIELAIKKAMEMREELSQYNLAKVKTFNQKRIEELTYKMYMEAINDR